jgi:hypothetical protein
MRCYVLVLLSSLLVSAACSSDPGTPQSCAHGVVQDLDAGHFDSALARLESRACEGAMTAEEIEINRAAAYIGKAGYDVADILLVVLDSDDEMDESEADVRLLEALTGLGEPGGLRHLARANDAYEQMVTAFDDGLNDACRDVNMTLLSPLQQDACFHSGLLAYVRLARGFDLLLQHQLPAFLDLEPLDCDNDRNFSDSVDEAEISSCALAARHRLDAGSGICALPGERDGRLQGAIRWERVAGVESVPFFDDGVQFASLVPVRITTEPGGACEGSRTDLRLLQPRPGASTEMVVTGGFCESEIRQSCAAADADVGCWPCPLPRLSGEGGISVAETLLDTVNFQAGHMLGVLNGEDRSEVATELEEMRQAFCEPVAGTPAECESGAGGTRVSLEAIRGYLRE